MFREMLYVFGQNATLTNASSGHPSPSSTRCGAVPAPRSTGERCPGSAPTHPRPTPSPGRQEGRRGLSWTRPARRPRDVWTPSHAAREDRRSLCFRHRRRQRGRSRRPGALPRRTGAGVVAPLGWTSGCPGRRDGGRQEYPRGDCSGRLNTLRTPHPGRYERKVL